MSAPQIVLYAAGPGFGLPDTSPFVLKTEVQLQMAGLRYDKRLTIPPQAPSGKLPYIEDQGEIVCDSTFIRAHIERKYEVDLDEGLDVGQRAQAWAIERMLEDHLYFAMVWFRWVDPENFAKGPAHFFDRAPESDRAALRQQMQGRKADDLRAQGIARHTPEKIAELGVRSIDAMAVLLGNRPYLFGDRCSAVDAMAFGVLAAVATPFFTSPLRAGLERHDTLLAYVDRMMGRYFAEHEWREAEALQGV